MNNRASSLRNSMKLIIAGTRDTDEHTAYQNILKGLRKLKVKPENLDCIITGGSGNVDAAGTAFAVAQQVDLQIHFAKWKKYGKAAGPFRNCKMARLGTHLLAIWDGKSPGTRNMIDESKRRNLTIQIIKI